jgi:hypothetical protein
VYRRKGLLGQGASCNGQRSSAWTRHRSHDEPAPLLDYPAIGTEEELRGADPLSDLLVPEVGVGEVADDDPPR